MKNKDSKIRVKTWDNIKVHLKEIVLGFKLASFGSGYSPVFLKKKTKFQGRENSRLKSDY